MRLRTKLSLAFLLVGLLPLTLASHRIFLDARAALDEQVEARLASLAASQRSRVEEFIHRNQERYELVAGRTQLRLLLDEYRRTRADADRRRIEAGLRDAVDSLEALKHGVILDREGTVIASTISSRLGVSYANEPFFPHAFDSAIEPRFFLAPGGGLHYRIAGPLVQEGETLGILVLEADPTHFLDALQDHRGMNETGETILVGRSDSGVPFYLTPLRFDPEAALRRPADEDDTVRQALAGRSAVVVEGRDYRGERVLAALEHIDPVDWALVVKIDHAEAYAPVHRIRDLVALVVLLACALTTGVSLFVARKITRPIIRLTRGARRIGAGDLSPVAGEPTSDELGVLVKAFNDMTLRLRNSYAAMEAQVEERKRAEEEARHLAAIVESSADAIDGTDLEGRVTSWNAAAEQLYGYPAEEMLGEPIDGIAPPSRADEPRRIREAIARGERLDDFETVRIARDGRPIEVSLTVSPIRDPGGWIVGSSTIARDITRRREAERDLAYAEARLAHILDAMPSIVVAVDPKRRVTHWNLKARERSGLSAADTLGTPIEETLPEFAEWLDRIGRAIDERKPQTVERVRTGTGSTQRSWDILVYPLVAESVLGAVVRIDDVTDRVAMAEVMIQSEKMMSVGSLAAGMAHEINNPLGAVLQAVQNIQRRISLDLPRNRSTAEALGVPLEAIREYLERRQVVRFLEGIREAGRRAAKIVSDMLAFSRQSRSRFAPSDIRECLETAVRLAATDYDLKKRYDFKHIEVVKDYDPTLGPVRCDTTKMEQVFFNLLKNAAQAMVGIPDRPHRIVLTTRAEGGFARIEIADNGPGMDEETRRRVFEPFFTTKEVGKGTGLGLSVSYFIVNQHGGTMSVESHEGEGTRFVLRLPLDRGE